MSRFGMVSVLFSYVTLSIFVRDFVTGGRLSDLLAAIGGKLRNTVVQRCKTQKQAVLGRHHAAGNNVTGR
jgi:hypothetical protein